MNDVIMKKSDDPQELFDKLTATENEYKKNDARIKVNKADLIVISLSVAPEKYQGVMASEHIQKVDAIALENLCTSTKTLFYTTKGKAASE